MVLGGQSREVIMLTDDNDHLPQPAASGHKRKFNTSNMQSLERLLHIAKQALETDYRSWGDSFV